ncbi:hypothetical protein AO442_001904 [Nakaseomyces glabratus]|nr:hypothetical protein AO443_001817 [Nakaseomyces glabratus]KTB24261.1 hypothetical protein AO442_001904 [Nakaseomyces glabratus]
MSNESTIEPDTPPADDRMKSQDTADKDGGETQNGKKDYGKVKHWVDVEQGIPVKSFTSYTLNLSGWVREDQKKEVKDERKDTSDK